MTPERYRHTGNIYGSALELQEDKRDALLDEAWSGDDALRAEVQTLMASDRDAGNFISASAIEAVGSGLARDHEIAGVGERFNYYVTHSFLGTGGMAEVHIWPKTKHRDATSRSNAESFYRLRSVGLVHGDSARDARLRCQLYSIYLERRLL